MTIDQATALAEQEIEDAKPLYKQVNNERLEFSQSDYDQAVIDLANAKMYEANKKWSQDRAEHYPSMVEFIEAYTEKEILDDSTKWDEYVVKYNEVRSDYPKPS
jgi:allantoicase